MTEIREGTPADLPQVRRIQSAALAEPWPAVLEPAADGPLDLYVIADGSVIGYAVVVSDGDSVAYVPEFAVDPARQGESYGSQLLTWLVDHLTGTGFDQLRVTVLASDDRARAFYADHGFEQRERIPDHFDDGDGILLVRSLD
jgi:ribosomal-protein-alanine N-acetyltransferase